MGASVTLEDEIKSCTKHDLKPGNSYQASNDRAETVFQLLKVVNILALLKFVEKNTQEIHDHQKKWKIL